MKLIAYSGGKDSTAMLLRLAEVEPETVEESRIISTPTGDELPGVAVLIQQVEIMIGKTVERLAEYTLSDLIESQRMIPNTKARWCTRMLKIQPVLALFALGDEPPEMCVGLRADEPERRGLFSERIVSRYPLREWGWGLQDVLDYLAFREVEIPRRTDCARCPFQRLHEWRDLLRTHPDIYADAEAQEERFGHTFRMPSRDTWPASLRELRQKFENGNALRGDWKRLQLDLFGDRDTELVRCRVCSL